MINNKLCILSERRQEERINRQLDQQIEHEENAENGKFENRFQFLIFKFIILFV